MGEEVSLGFFVAWFGGTTGSMGSALRGGFSFSGFGLDSISDLSDLAITDETGAELLIALMTASATA